MTTSITPLYAFPYPEGDEYVIGGDDAIEALAKRLEACLAPALWGGYRNGSVQNAATAGVGVLQSLSVETAGHFTYDNGNGVLTYNGPRRPFTVAGGLSMHAAQGSQVVADLRIRGIVIARSEFYDPGTNGYPQWVTHALDWSGFLAAGDTVQITASAPDGTPIHYPRLHVASTGPTEA